MKMKEKVLMMAAAVGSVLLVFLLVWYIETRTPQQKPHEMRYAQGIIQHLDYENNTVTVQTTDGNLWEFEGCDDWLVKDLCMITFDDNGTPFVADDLILNVRYTGWVE